jgi:hypothetical protein
VGPTLGHQLATQVGCVGQRKQVAGGDLAWGGVGSLGGASGLPSGKRAPAPRGGWEDEEEMEATAADEGAD